MNVSPELSPILTGLQKRFRNRLDAVHSKRSVCPTPDAPALST